jgi:Domain of unknown function (DUF4287)
MHHSEETHKQLVAKVPEVTGKEIKEWFNAIEDGPALTRFDERVTWLQDEYSIPHGHATAIVHEYDLHKAAHRMG